MNTQNTPTEHILYYAQTIMAASQMLSKGTYPGDMRDLALGLEVAAREIIKTTQEQDNDKP